jgi:hypothetical protein
MTRTDALIRGLPIAAFVIAIAVYIFCLHGWVAQQVGRPMGMLCGFAFMIVACLGTLWFKELLQRRWHTRPWYAR